MQMDRGRGEWEYQRELQKESLLVVELRVFCELTVYGSGAGDWLPALLRSSPANRLLLSSDSLLLSSFSRPDHSSFPSALMEWTLDVVAVDMV